jgi:type I restriction enzyme M protein
MENQRGTAARRIFATQASLDSYIKGICDILRRSNCAGALQYVPELTWILFLRILDENETHAAEAAAAVGAEFTPSLQAPYRWQDWAAPAGSKRVELQNAQMGAFFAFVNGDLIPHLRNLKTQPDATPRQRVISEIMSGVERTRVDTDATARRAGPPPISAANVDNTHIFPLSQITRPVAQDGRKQRRRPVLHAA